VKQIRINPALSGVLVVYEISDEVFEHLFLENLRKIARDVVPVGENALLSFGASVQEIVQSLNALPPWDKSKDSVLLFRFDNLATGVSGILSQSLAVKVAEAVAHQSEIGE